MSVHHASTTGPRQAAEETQTELRAAELREENEQLQQAVTSHAVIDQAIGVLLAVGDGSPDQSWDVLREISQRTNIKLRHVAELVVEWARTRNLCTDIHTELDRQLALYARRPQSGS